MRALLFVTLSFAFSNAFAQTDIGQRLQSEFQRLQAHVTTLEPDETIGGYIHSKSYGDHELLWRTHKGEAEVIRVYRDKGDEEQPFEVGFYKNKAIVPGTTVIRRFVGPASTGWRNDTVDAETGEYLGSQGSRHPRLDKRDQEILKQWEIQLFD